MIWKIAKKDFLLNIMTFKFAVGTILCVVFMVVFTSILLKDYEQRLENYNQAVSDDATEMRKAKVYKNISPVIRRPPEVLSIFSNGLEKKLENSIKINFDNAPEIENKYAEKNPLLVIFTALDISLIFEIVLSILALLIAYDTISGEKERGTLKLILSDAAPRYKILIGKILAGLTTLFIPITISFIIVSLMFCFSPNISLSWSEWLTIILMYLVSLIYISVIYNIGLLLSSLTKKSTTSLMFALLFWIIFALLIPNISVSLAREFFVPEPSEKIDRQIADIEAEFDRKYAEFAKNLPPRAEDESYEQGAYGEMYVKVTTLAGMQRYQQIFAYRQPLREKFADKIWEIHKEYFRELAHQKNIADNISRCSPISMYGNIMSTLSGTDLHSYDNFINQAMTYRKALGDYIRAKTNNFSTASYFIAANENDIEEWTRLVQKFTEDVDQLKKTSGNDSLIGFLTELHEPLKRFANKLDEKNLSLDLSDSPGFAYKARNAIGNLRNCLFDITVLVLINIMFFSLSFAAFLRYDAR